MAAKPDTVFWGGRKSVFTRKIEGHTRQQRLPPLPAEKGNWRESLLSARRRVRLPHGWTAKHVEEPSRSPAANNHPWLSDGQRETSRATGS